jgi:signal transduction histidine kinase
VAAAKATVHQQNKGEARVLAVADHLVQVFVNLVTNACHALPTEGGTITLESECVHEGPGGECVRISVRDSGTGVPEAMRSKIFTPFFTTKGDDRGSGLGLYVVRTVIEEHGGTVVLDGGVGGGACFVVTLPLENSTLRSLG